MPGRGGIEPSRKATGVDIAVRGIAKRFTGHAALHEVDLTIGSGELVALLGPSGSGKTTLLRILAGLEMPDAGTVHFDGVDATEIRVQDRCVGFVFQHYALFRHLTVADNIAYGLHVRPRAKRPPEQAIRRRVSELLELVQLSGLEARYPAQLSGGQRQRVALARALAIEPRVLLLDEPFGALDAKVRKDLRRWLRGIHERTGQTTVFVTHDQDEALELADRVAILNQGRIEQVGDAEAIYDHPASAFVVSFVGEVAELAVSVRGGRVAFAGREIPVSAQGLPDGVGRLFLRPAETRLRPHSEAGLPARLVGVRRTSNGHRAEVEVEGHPGIIEVESDLLAGTIGGAVTLALDRARLFPA